MRFNKKSHKIELRKRKLPKSKGKGEKEKQQKNGKSLAKQGLPCGNGSYNFEKDSNLQRKNENYIWDRKMKKRGEKWGEDIRAPTIE